MNLPFNLAPADGLVHLVAAVWTPSGVTHYLDGERVPE